jgi:universal protein Kae1
MICIGIEGTAHSIGVGIIDDDCNILANAIKMYQPPAGGIHPREAANHHATNIPIVLRDTLEKSGISFKDIDLVGFSIGPGLGPCLRTTATAARALSLSLNVPIVGVNHCLAHLEIGKATTGASDVVLLYVSGGNTQIIAFSNGKYRVFGETLDIGIGNCLDKFGRMMGLPFPSGPLIEKMSRDRRKYVPLPYSVKGMDVAFSGILTAAKLHLDREKKEDLCFSLQETCFAMLTEVTERAMAHTEKNEVLLGGGVACNKRLQEMISSMAKNRGATAYFPPKKLLVDNGAMIAWTALVMAKNGYEMKISDTVINQNYRVDDVEVNWIDDA